MSQTLQYLTDEHGDRTAVVLPIGEYEKLLEDLEDLAVVAERRDEPVGSHDDFLAQLKRDDAAWDSEVRDRIRAIDEGRVAGVIYEDVMRSAEERLVP